MRKTRAIGKGRYLSGGSTDLVMFPELHGPQSAHFQCPLLNWRSTLIFRRSTMSGISCSVNLLQLESCGFLLKLLAHPISVFFVRHPLIRSSACGECGHQVSRQTNSTLVQGQENLCQNETGCLQESVPSNVQYITEHKHGNGINCTQTMQKT